MPASPVIVGREADGIEVPTDKALDEFFCTIFGIALQKFNS
jgi:hypothetical protein